MIHTGAEENTWGATHEGAYPVRWKRIAAFTVLFFAFLQPVTVVEASVNYAFVLVPLALVATSGNIQRLPSVLLTGALLFSLIFVASTLFYIGAEVDPFRRVGSFVVFMSLFSYAMIRIQPEMVPAFKYAVILASVFFSLVSIFRFVGFLELGPVHFEAKNLVGSQRYGFIYLMAFWLTLLDPVGSRKQRLLNYAFLAIIIGGLLLTFSRSALVALAGSGLLYGFVRVLKGMHRPSVVLWSKLAMGFIGIAIAAAAAYYLFPLTIEYYSTTFLDPLLDGSLFTALSLSGSSEGIRVVRVIEGIDFVLRNPFTGTGFLGIWAFSPTGGGSAHNQLLDTFIRVGLFGFTFYMYLLLRLVACIGRIDRALFWGVISVLIYGLFHETFKESQGAFVLAFLVGIAAQHWRAEARAPERSARVSAVEALT